MAKTSQLFIAWHSSFIHIICSGGRIYLVASDKQLLQTRAVSSKNCLKWGREKNKNWSRGLGVRLQIWTWAPRPWPEILDLRIRGGDHLYLPTIVYSVGVFIVQISPNTSYITLHNNMTCFCVVLAENMKSYGGVGSSRLALFANQNIMVARLLVVSKKFLLWASNKPHQKREI